MDNDDDGNDADIDGNGFYQPVWDRGILSQGLRSPSYYDVDNDNDGVPDAEDWDDDNNNLSDAEQELIPVVSGEKNNLHLTTIMTAFQIGWMMILMAMDFQIQKNLTQQDLLVFDHDNDGLRDDLDKDDDEDGMEDKDEVWLCHHDLIAILQP